MRNKKPNFRVKHPYQNLISSILMGLVLLLSAVLSVFVITQGRSDNLGFVDAYGGNGSEEQPYLIYNRDDLLNVSFYSNRSRVAGRGTNQRHFKLMADINATKVYNIVEDNFDGFFHGNSKTLTTNMQIFNTISKGSKVSDLTINVVRDETLYDLNSSFSAGVYNNNIKYVDQFNQILGGNTVLEVSDNVSINKAVYYGVYVKPNIDYYKETLVAQLEELNQAPETNKVRILATEREIEKNESFSNKIDSAINLLGIKLSDYYDETPLNPVYQITYNNETHNVFETSVMEVLADLEKNASKEFVDQIVEDSGIEKLVSRLVEEYKTSNDISKALSSDTSKQTNLIPFSLALLSSLFLLYPL